MTEQFRQVGEISQNCLTTYQNFGEIWTQAQIL